MRCIILNRLFSTSIKLGGLVLCLALVGCFGGERALKRAGGYKVRPPKAWSPTRKGKSDYAYRLSSGALVAVSSSCERHAHANLQVLTRHLLIGTKSLMFEKQHFMEVDGKQGLYSSVRGKVEREPIYFQIFVVSKNDCIFDFTLLNRKRIAKAEIDQFLRFVKSFRYAKRKNN